jgi:L-gulonate 3-dehydrogenase
MIKKLMDIFYSVMSDGLGMRYAFLGPMETAHLNAEGSLKIERKNSKI